MSYPKFFIGLVVLAFGSALIFLGMSQWVSGASGMILVTPTIIFFTLFSLLLFFTSDWGLKSGLENLFTQISLLSILLKIVLCMGILLFYKERGDISSVYDIAPFLVSYILYTVYEVYFLSKLALSKKHTPLKTKS